MVIEGEKQKKVAGQMKTTKKEKVKTLIHTHAVHSVIKQEKMPL